MDFLKDYLTHNEPTTTKKMVNNYKIITTNDKNHVKPFLIYEQDQVLNSKTLMKLLLIKTLPDDMLNKLINNSSPLSKDLPIVSMRYLVFCMKTRSFLILIHTVIFC